MSPSSELWGAVGSARADPLQAAGAGHALETVLVRVCLPGKDTVSKYRTGSQRKPPTFTLDSDRMEHALSFNKRLTLLLSFFVCQLLLV